MLRAATISSTTKNDSSQRRSSDGGITKKYDNAKTKAPPFISKVLCPVLFTMSSLLVVILYNNSMAMTSPTGRDAFSTAMTSSTGLDRSLENSAFAKVINRTKYHQRHCKSIGLSIEPKNDFSKLAFNNHTAHLPQYGFLDAVRGYRDSDPNDIDNTYPYRCQLPPENECGETQFTVIFMAYNPDRLKKLLNEINNMLTDSEFSQMVAEVIIVWNGERHIDETDLGKKMVNLEKTLPLRISYPLKAGFPNDLMNRYHPRLEVKTKAIMYYDDDGPFYSYKAVLGGFELWKRNSNAQIGAMARKLDLGPRQADESEAASKKSNDKFFISQCPTDEVHYNFFTFTNFDARMVLPSGSFLHSNYLCFIWHPIFEDIRQYVRRHPVNPDDGTVSMLVSQLAGRAPKVYSRRIKDQEKSGNPPARQQRRRLMDGIDWDSKGAEDKKMNWGRLRSDVANSLARYFGSINSGSLGWCYGTEYHINKKKQDLCNPEMAAVGMLPWMKMDHSAGDTCP